MVVNKATAVVTTTAHPDAAAQRCVALHGTRRSCPVRQPCAVWAWHTAWGGAGPAAEPALLLLPASCRAAAGVHCGHMACCESRPRDGRGMGAGAGAGARCCTGWRTLAAADEPAAAWRPHALGSRHRPHRLVWARWDDKDGACGDKDGACGDKDGACGDKDGACGDKDGACGDKDGVQ
jgi:hypothetical protein